MPSARGSQVCTPGSRVIYSQRGAIAPGGRSACDLCALNTPTGYKVRIPPSRNPHPKKPAWAGLQRSSPCHRAYPSYTHGDRGQYDPPVSNPDGQSTSDTSVVVGLPLASLSCFIHVLLSGSGCWDPGTSHSDLMAGWSVHSGQQRKWWRLSPTVSRFGKYQPTSAH